MRAIRTDADGGSLRVQDDALALQVLGAAPDDVGNLGVVGVGEGDVADEAVLEEGEGAVALGAVDDLVRDDEVHGADLLAQGADGGEADDGAHAQRPQGGDVGAGGDLVRRELVVLAVAGQEGDGHAAVFEDQDRRRRITPGRQRVYACDGHVAVDLVEPGAADDGDLDGSCGRETLVSTRATVRARLSRGALREGERRGGRGGRRREEEMSRENITYWWARTVKCLRKIRHD